MKTAEFFVLVVAVVIILVLIAYSRQPSCGVKSRIGTECTSAADCVEGNDCRLGFCKEITCYNCSKFKRLSYLETPDVEVYYVNEINGIGFQSSGKLISTGSVTNRVYLYRNNVDGTLDASFGGSLGIEIAGQWQVRHLLVLPDDSILTLTQSGFFPSAFKIFKHTPEGVIDTGFGTGGFVALPGYAESMCVDDDLNVYACGDGKLVKCSAAGVMDTGFGTGGFANFQDITNIDIITITYAPIISRMSVANGKLLAGGLYYLIDPSVTSSDPDFIGSPGFVMGVARFNLDGTLDTTYGNQGFSYVDNSTLGNQREFCSTKDGYGGDQDEAWSYGSVYASDGTVYVTATMPMQYFVNACNDNPLVIAKFLPSGELDASYADNGLLIYANGSNTYYYHYGGAGFSDCDGGLILGLSVYNNEYVGQMMRIDADGKNYVVTEYDRNSFSNIIYYETILRDGVIYAAGTDGAFGIIHTFECT